MIERCGGRETKEMERAKKAKEAKERLVNGKASRTVLKAATVKKDDWKQERHSHIASKMKSMLMDGGRRQRIKFRKVADGNRSDILGNRCISGWI